MDRIVWTLIDKTSGLPVPNKTTVVARPVQNTTSAGDIPMPEVGTGTAIYATTNEVPHGIYRIRVDSADTNDEVEVDAGRVKWTKASGGLAYPVMDRVVDAKCVLSGVLDDTVETAGSADLVLAIAAATGAKPRELVLDQDVTLSTSVTDLAQPLTVDLNGRTLTLNGNIYSSKKIVIRNGVIAWGSGRTITSLDSVAFIGVRFSGTTATMGNAKTSYIGCYGLTVNANAGGANGDVATVIGGQHSFGHIGQINLTDLGSNTGSERATWLQALIDIWYPWLALWKSAVEWLTSTKRASLDAIVNWLQPEKFDVLQEWVDLNPTMRAMTRSVPTNIEQSIAIVRGSTYSGSSLQVPGYLELVTWGFKFGLNEMRPLSSSWSLLRGCLGASVVIDGDGATTFLCNIHKIAYPVKSWLSVNTTGADPVKISNGYACQVTLYRIEKIGSSKVERVPFAIAGDISVQILAIDAVEPFYYDHIKFPLTINTTLLPYESGKTVNSYYYAVEFQLLPDEVTNWPSITYGAV